MALFFTGNWEHAVLTAIARRAGCHPDKGYLGRTALQKIVYFLQQSGVPLRYRFDLYHYGPYCDQVSRDVERLMADDVLRDASQNPDRYSNYRPATAEEELRGMHAAKLDEYQKTIDKVVESLLPLEPDHLELLATLDYLYRQKRAGGGRGPWKEAVIGDFMKVKKDKFSQQQVSQAYESMVAARIFEP